MNETIKGYFRELFSMSSSLATHLLLFIPFSTKVLSESPAMLLDEFELAKVSRSKVVGGGEGEDAGAVKGDNFDLFVDLNSFRNVKRVHKPKPDKPKNSHRGPNIKIDQRGIFKGSGGGKGSGRGTGIGHGKATTLNLPGWTWDSKPIVKDSSNEIGKIVFEFTIDDLGYVISIRTLEKTVSNYVEKLYRDAVLNLTFKKIDKVKPAEETVGRITFLLQYSE